MNNLAGSGITKYPAKGGSEINILQMSQYLLDHRTDFEASQIGAYSIQNVGFSSKKATSVNRASYVIHGNFSALHAGPLYCSIMADTIVP